MKPSTILLLVLTTFSTAVPATAADSYFKWVGTTGGGDGTNWFDGDNWYDYDYDTFGNLPSNDATWINNGDTVLADVANMGVFRFEPTRVNVGCADQGNLGGNPVGTSTLTVLGLSISPSYGVKVGYNTQLAQAVAGSLSVNNGNLTVGDAGIQIGVASGDLAGTTTSGVLQVNGIVSAADNEDDPRAFQIGRYDSSSGQSGQVSGQAIATLGLARFGSIEVGIHQNNGGSGSATGQLSVSAGGISPKLNGENESLTTLKVGVSSGAGATANGTATVFNGDVSSLLSLTVGSASGDATTQATGDVTLEKSYATIGTVSLAHRAAGTESASASLVLTPAILETASLIVGEGGTVTLHAGGLPRMTGATAYDPNTYAAIDADYAGISGKLVFDFDFTPPAGTHTFDLIVTDSPTGLDASSAMTLEVADLPAGFEVYSFGVVEDGGVDKLRLVVGPELPETFTFNASFDDDFLYRPNWTGSRGGTASPSNMGALDTYVVPVNAQILGPVTLAGHLEVNGGAVLTVASGKTLTVNTGGTMDVAGGSQIAGTGSVTINGALEISGSGTVNVSPALVLNNTLPAGRVLSIAPGTELQNTGSISFTAGEALVRGSWKHNRFPLQALPGTTIVGDGLINGSLLIYGRLEPGPETGNGDLNIQGYLQCIPGCVVEIEVAGSGAGEFDRVLVSGQVEYAGGVVVDFSARPLAQAGTYDFLIPGSAAFSFPTRTPLGLAPTRAFSYLTSSPGQFTIASTGTAYQDWAFVSNLTTGVNDGFDDDPNFDGVPNILHFAQDTHPLTSAGGNEGKQRIGFLDIGGTDHFSITLPVRNGATFAGSPSPSATVDGIVYAIQGTTTLDVWTEPVSEVTPADSAGLPPLRDIDGDGTPDWEYRTFVLDNNTLPRGFLRSEVQTAP